MNKIVLKLLYIWLCFLSLTLWVTFWPSHWYLGLSNTFLVRQHIFKECSTIDSDIFFQANDASFEASAFLILLWDSWERFCTTNSYHISSLNCPYIQVFRMLRSYISQFCHQEYLQSHTCDDSDSYFITVAWLTMIERLHWL